MTTQSKDGWRGPLARAGGLPARQNRAIWQRVLTCLARSSFRAASRRTAQAGRLCDPFQLRALHSRLRASLLSSHSSLLISLERCRHKHPKSRSATCSSSGRPRATSTRPSLGEEFWPRPRALQRPWPRPRPLGAPGLSKDVAGDGAVVDGADSRRRHTPTKAGQMNPSHAQR